MADKIEEVKTICWCGKKATFNARFDAAGKVLKEGEQVVLGANDQYIGLCRKHWMAGDLGGLPPRGPAVICRLCPRNCGEADGDRRGGVCGCPACPVAAQAMLHLWEEPCLVGSAAPGACSSPAAISGAASARTSPSPRGRWERS